MVLLPILLTFKLVYCMSKGSLSCRLTQRYCTLISPSCQYWAAPLTVCDSSQCLVEGGGVAVVSQGDTHSSREQPAGEGERLFVLKKPVFKLFIIHLFTLPEKHRKAALVSVCQCNENLSNKEHISYQSPLNITSG